MTDVANRSLVVLALWVLGTAWNISHFNLHSEIVRRYQPEFVVLPRPDVVKLAAVGFDSLAADLYWIRGINYYGDTRNQRVAFAEFSNYMNLVVALDPDFEFAYEFSGVAIPWNTGREWVDVDQADSLLESGIKRFPNNWRLRFELAYNYSSYRSRYKDAGDQLAAAALLPGAPKYLASLATRMYATTGDYSGAEAIAEELYLHSPDPQVRKTIKKRAAELRTVRDREHLQNLVDAFRASHGRFPSTLGELVSMGMIQSIPNESLGGHFEYDSKTGRVESSILLERLKIFVRHESTSN